MNEVYTIIPITQNTMEPDNEVFLVGGDGTSLNAWFQVI